MDAAWPRIADAVMAPVLGPQLDELATLQPRFDQPPGGQSSGWHSYVLQGPPRPVRAEAGGAVPRALLRRGQRGRVPDGAVGGDRRGGQRARRRRRGRTRRRGAPTRTKERITFVPGLLKTTLRYTNRPTGIQQVISFKGHRAAQ